MLGAIFFISVSNRTEHAHGFPCGGSRGSERNGTNVTSPRLSLLEKVFKPENNIADINRSLPDAELEKNVDINGKRNQGLLNFLRNVNEDIAKLKDRFGNIGRKFADEGAVVETVSRSSLEPLLAPSTSGNDCGLEIRLKHWSKDHTINVFKCTLDGIFYNPAFVP